MNPETIEPVCHHAPTQVLDADVIIPVAAAALLALAVLLWPPPKPNADMRARQQWLLAAATCGAFLLFNAAINCFAPGRSRWRWDLATFPAVLVAMQGVFIYGSRKRGVIALIGAARPQKNHALAADLADARKQLRASAEQYFSATTLLLRYGVPAFFIFSFGIGMSNAILREWNPYITSASVCRDAFPTSPTELMWPRAALTGAAYGLAGAYLFCALSLGYRAFQQDITVGTASWCAVILGIGPVVAAVVAMAWPANNGEVLGVHAALYFTVGFSPRYGVRMLEWAAKRIYSAEQYLAANSRPLNQVRGISDDIANRLEEEGISNVSQMAAANPIPLLRNTRFDRRQIVAWIDTAVLMEMLPKQFPQLADVGIAKATSLAWYSRALHDRTTPAHDERQVTLKKLVDAAKVGDFDVIQAASGRLAHDEQVQALFVLNACIEDEADNIVTLPEGAPSTQSVPAPQVATPIASATTADAGARQAAQAS